jgi:hypothetical protein
MAKRVTFTERHAPGKATTYTVGVIDSRKHCVLMLQTFYRKDSKKRAEAYADWLNRLLALEQEAASRNG